MSSTLMSSFKPEAVVKLDRHYTSPQVANQLLHHVTVTGVSRVADFACGSGNLLEAAAQRWPDATLYANDIDATAAVSTALKLGISTFGDSDFLAHDFHSFAGIRATDQFDLILLNPPFTNPLGPFPRARGKRADLTCSRAIAFVLTAVEYLAPTGQLLAILPSSTIHTKTDREAWRVLRESYRCDIVRPPEYGLFSTADVSTYVLRLTPKTIPDGPASQIPLALPDHLPWRIHRGRLSVPRRERSVAAGLGWVHTTSLMNGGVVERYILPESSRLEFTDYGALLLPRVGSFGADKVVLLSQDSREIISDCLLAISMSDRQCLQLLHKSILSYFSDFRSLYLGTGAPYITNERLNRFLWSKTSGSY